MNIGCRITAPFGYHGLTSGVDYLLLGSCQTNHRVTLIWFGRPLRKNKTPGEWKVYVIRLARQLFEEGLQKQLLLMAEGPGVPPWLASASTLDLSAKEAGRRNPKMTYEQRAEGRYARIAALLDRSQDLLASEDLLGEITRYGNKQIPRQNGHRLAIWYCAYLVFGRDLSILGASFHDNGKWDRTDLKYADKVLGRPNRTDGPIRGGGSSTAIPEIISSYTKYTAMGKSMSSVYEDAMLKTFGCKTRVDDRGLVAFYHPDGKSFPTLGMYRYRVKQHFGLERVQRNRLGDALYRVTKAPSQGKYSESVSNILQSSESDCYYATELPRQLLSDKPGLPLCVCLMICSASGSIVGVGFSYGSETAEAYEIAKFFAVAPNDLLGRLFGIDPQYLQFPIKGLPPKEVGDRGPGQSHAANMDGKPAISELTPSWSGQSKAMVESKHPRTVRPEGQPSHRVSPLNVYEMIKQELLRASAKNASGDASGRMTPEMIAANTPATPNGIALYLLSRGRTDAIAMPVERAIRAFLRPVSFEINMQGLFLLHQRYDSTAYRQLGLDKLATRGGAISIQGFVCGFAVRIAWIEWRGRLFEVEARLPLHDDPRQLFTSYAELESNAAQLAKLKTERERSAAASRARAKQAFAESTGKQMDSGRRILGQAPSRRARRVATDITQPPGRPRKPS